MTPFRLINRTALHIFGYRRLLVWNLLSCFIYVSCSTQMKQGAGNDDITNETRVTDLEMSNLKNKNNDTGLFATIKHYCKNNTCSTAQKKIEKKINILCDDYFIKGSSNKTTHGDNLLHFIIRLLSDGSLPEPKKNFLEKITINLIDRSLGVLNLLDSSNAISPYITFHKNNPEMVNKLTKNLYLINQVNNDNETPLHVATKLNNKGIFKQLFNWTDLTIEDTDGNTPYDLIIKKPEILEALVGQIIDGNIPYDFIIEKPEILEALVGQIKAGKISFSDIKRSSFYNGDKDYPATFMLLMKKIATLDRYDTKLNRYIDCFFSLDKLSGEYDREHHKASETAYEFKHKGYIDKDEIQQCGICYMDLPNNIIEIKSCKHYFDGHCFVKLLYNFFTDANPNETELTCPYCRGLITTRQLQ